MSGTRLGRSFFRDQSALQLAKNLLGCVLVHTTPDGVIAGVITETEAYTESDEASHCFCGRKNTKNEVMFSAGGHMYVYFTYGMYHCVNVVSGVTGKGSAVLLRSVSLTDGADLAYENRVRARRRRKVGTSITPRDVANGPGKLCEAFGFDRGLTVWISLVAGQYMCVQEAGCGFAGHRGLVFHGRRIHCGVLLQCRVVCRVLSAG